MKEKLNELQSMFDEMVYQYGEEIESLFDDEERETKYAAADEMKEKFHAIVAELSASV